MQDFQAMGADRQQVGLELSACHRVYCRGVPGEKPEELPFKNASRECALW